MDVKLSQELTQILSSVELYSAGSWSDLWREAEIMTTTFNVANYINGSEIYSDTAHTYII